MPPASEGGRSAPNGNNVCVACGQQGRTPCLDEPVCNPGFTLGTNSGGFPACVSCGGPCPGECGGLREPPCIDAQGNPFCTYVPPANEGGRSAPNGNNVCVACGQMGRTPCLDEPVCNPGFFLGENASGAPACLFCGQNCPGDCGGLGDACCDGADRCDGDLVCDGSTCLDSSGAPRERRAQGVDLFEQDIWSCQGSAWITDATNICTLAHSAAAVSARERSEAALISLRISARAHSSTLLCHRQVLIPTLPSELVLLGTRCQPAS